MITARILPPDPVTERPSIFDALSRVMGSVQAVKKADRNTEQNYNFRGIDAVVNAVGPALREHGVLVTPELLEVGYRDVLTSRGKPSRECTVRVRYRFHGPAGDHLDVVVPGESMDFGDKGAAKAMSVAFRIALLQALAIPTDEPEHDPDASSYERAERPPHPSPEQVQAYELVLAELQAVTQRADISRVGKKAIGARDKGHITPEQFHALDVAAGEKIRELSQPQAAPVDDRTAESPEQQPEGQQSLEGDWPEPARPAGSDPT